MGSTQRNTTKKKKRKLKKSVRRGCLSFLLIMLVLTGAIVYECSRSPEEKEIVQAEKVPLGPDLTDTLLAEKLHHLVSTAPRVDSAQMAVCVYDIDHQCYVYEHRSHQLMTPASCMKLLTGITAMKRLGVNHHYHNQVFIRGSVSNGVLYGDLILVMDDDPMVDSFTPYISGLRKRGINRIEGGVVLDLMRTDTLRQHHTAKPWDISYHRVPLLMKGEKRVRRELMAALAAQDIRLHENPLFTFLGLLNVNKEKEPQRYQLALKTARIGAELIHDERHPIQYAMIPMLNYSDNILAECIFHHTNHALDRWGGGRMEENHAVCTFVREEMSDRCSDPYVINDGSGLSPENRLTADFLTHLMVYAYEQPDIRNALIEEALASPGGSRRGSLTGRMHQSVFHNKIFCKTGTLTATGVSSLTGYAQGADGRWLAFSILNENTAVLESRAFQDRLCRILVSTPN